MTSILVTVDLVLEEVHFSEDLLHVVLVLSRHNYVKKKELTVAA